MVDPYPAGPEQPYTPPTKGPAPASVRTAITLIWVGVGLSVLSTVITLLQLDDLVHRVTGNDASISDDTARVTLITGSVIGLAFGVGVSLLFVYFLNKGANWARIVFTVLRGLGVLIGVFSLLGDQPVALLLIGLLSIVVTIATIVLLFRPDSNAFFSAPQPR